MCGWVVRNSQIKIKITSKYAENDLISIHLYENYDEDKTIEMDKCWMVGPFCAPFTLLYFWINSAELVI